MFEKTNRRTVLKGIGAGVAGSVALSGAVAAGDPDDQRRNDSYTWANDVIYEMQIPEPLIQKDGELLNPDEEGNHNGLRPLYIVAPQNDEHSPHDTFMGLTFDHVIDLEPGKQFYSAQWHTHFVFDDPSTFSLAKTGVDGAALTNEDAILAADGDEVTVIPAFTDEGEPGAFTCPVRPHQHE